MNNSVKLLIYLCLCTCNVFAEQDHYEISCPAIKECKPNDGPKKNRNYAKINQEAYDCFRSTGQTDLANKAFTAKTKCQAIYGATTATIGPNDQAVSASKKN